MDDRTCTFSKTTLMTLPKTQRAVLGRLPTAGQGALLCADNHPIPTIEDDRVLVKAHHVALNPYDWKGVRYKFALKEVAAVMGRDGSGVVVSVGDKVKLFEPGDRVCRQVLVSGIPHARYGSAQMWPFPLRLPSKNSPCTANTRLGACQTRSRWHQQPLSAPGTSLRQLLSSEPWDALWLSCRNLTRGAWASHLSGSCKRADWAPKRETDWQDTVRCK
jgi:hypothetical protein